MKKNFMAIASLLIAAMLLVVSCAPEANVEGKVEDGLVEAVIGLGRSAKDITITNGDANAKIKYKYKMTAAWKSTDTGAPIYGEVSSFENIPTTKNSTGYGITEGVENVSLGKVTPGLWNIEVNGYCNDKLVLQGKASAYFNGSGTKATVFVAPVSDGGNVKVKITLKMQDLEDLEESEEANYDRIGYAFTNLSGDPSIVEEGENNHVMLVASSDGGVNTYAETTVYVKSGYNTVTFSLPGYSEKGGITKTFLAIPGVDVTITGSVTPAEFKDGTADIKVLSIEGGSIAIKNGQTTVGQTSADGASIYALTKGTSYTFTYSNSASDSNNETFTSAINGADAGTLDRTYTWYVGTTEITNNGDVKSVYTHDFSDYDPGYYNITCIETVSFKIEGQDYKLRTSATLANVRVLKATTQS